MSESAGSSQNPRMVTTSNAVLGHLLGLIRRRRKLTQAQVAEALGLAGSTWSRVEKGETPITVEQLRVVADKLGVNATILLGLAEQAENALRSSGFVVGSAFDEETGLGRAGAGLLGAVASANAVASRKPVPFGLFGAVLPLVGTALGAFLGNALGSALDKALATKPESPPTTDKG